MKLIIRLFFFIPLFSASVILNAQVESVQLYTFAHSLIDHRPPAIATPSDETTIIHWMNDIAQEAGKDFSSTGQFGQLSNHVDNLPPNSNLGYENVSYSWDETEASFGNSSLNTIMLTPANFIQYSPASDPDPSDPFGRTVVAMTNTLFDWTNTEIPGMRYYIYGNWPEMDLQNAFPPTLPLTSEIEEFHDQNIGLSGPFANWWTDYQDLLVESQPELNPRLIPVGMLISKILRDVLSNSIPFDELYEDSAPHGRANVYFLAGMITYMAVYEENIPATYLPYDIIHQDIRDNMEAISNYAWQELNAFNFPNGDSRVFYGFVNSVNSNLDDHVPSYQLFPSMVDDSFSLTGKDLTKKTVRIIGMDGKIALEVEATADHQIIDVQHLVSGLYLVEILDENDQVLYQEKLMVK